MNFKNIKGSNAKKLALRRIYNGIKADGKMLEERCYTDEEKLEYLDVLLNMKKIVENYDELEPVLTKFFCEKAEKDKFKRVYIEEMEH